MLDVRVGLALVAPLEPVDDRPRSPIAELVKRARKGDSAALGELVSRHLRATYAVALAVLGRPADAEDVAQEAFLVALERLADCRDPARFSGWLIQIVRNRAHHALEKRKLRDPTDDVADAPSHSATGDIVMRRRLLAALAVLTPVQREIMLLHDLDDWTHAEIADALGLTETNCRQHLFMARRTMRGALKEEPSHGD